MKEKIDIDGIDNADQLKEAYEKLVAQYEEVIKNAGPIAKKAIQLGYKAQVAKINKKYEQIKQSITDTKKDIGNIGEQGRANEIGVAHDASAKKQEARQWQNAHEDRNSVVTGAVGAVKKGEISAKSIVALGAIKLTTFGAKGARLFGAKGTAQKIAESGSKYAEALFTKDSRIGDFAEKMAKSGFMKADDVRDTIARSKEMLEAYGRAGIQMGKDAVDAGKRAVSRAADTVRDTADTVVTAAYTYGSDAVGAVKNTADTVVTAAYTYGSDAVAATKRKAEDIILDSAIAVESAVNATKDYVKNAREDIGDIGEQGRANEMGVARDASAKKQEARQWQDAHENRNSIVTGAVGAVKKGEISAKSVVALGAIKLTTFGAKGARLFGAKGTAQKIAESGSKYAEALFTKDSRIGDFAEKMAKSGFMKADDVRDTIARSKEMLGAYGRAGIQAGKEMGEKTVEATKKGALAVGKAALIPAAAIGAVGELSLKTAKRGVEAVGKKASEIREDMGNYGEVAIAKTQSVKNNMKVGFFSKVSKFLEGVKGNIDKSLVNSKEKQEQSNERLTAAKMKVAPQVEAQTKETQDDEGR